MRLRTADDGRYRLFTPLEDIASTAQEATLLYEDRGFYGHFGVDPLALLRAAWTTYVQRSRLVGGSTITMQLARLRFGLDTRSVSGKLIQTIRALQIERHYDKAQILEAYLNLAPYGGAVEGIGTASRIYFDKPASALDLGQALALAVIPQNPSARFAATDAGRTKLLAARERLFAAWKERASANENEPAPAALLEPVFRPPSALPFRAPHFVRDHLPPNTAPTLRTTLDWQLQTLLAQRIGEHVAHRSRDGIDNAATMLLDHRSMEVLALVGSASFFADAIDGQVNGVRARRSPGSTLKPLLYALALDAGLIHPMTLLADAPRRYAGYAPENFDRGFLGPVFRPRCADPQPQRASGDHPCRGRRAAFPRLAGRSRRGALAARRRTGLGARLGRRRERLWKNSFGSMRCWRTKACGVSYGRPLTRHTPWIAAH